MIVTIKHTKGIGYCNAGLRRWFEGRDKTFSEFVIHGATDEWFLAQDCAMAARLVEYARAAESAEGK